MTEPRIQYAKTSDGVSIAYWTIGEGKPLMYTPHSSWGHCQLEWEWPEWRAWYERIASKRMLIRFDGRGTGLSDRDVSDISFDTAILDVEAVLRRLDLDTFHLLGNYLWANAAVRYAAAHPERVSSLVLWCPMVKPSDVQPGMWTLADMGKTDWKTFTEVATKVALDPPGEQAKRAAEFMRESIDASTYNATVDAYRDVDVSGLLPQIAVPTLVVHRDEAVPTLQSARDVASGIPNARLAVLEGKSLWPFVGDSDSVLQAIEEFMAEDEEASPPAQAPGGFATILFTDMERSAALRQQLGDANAQKLVRTHNQIVRAALDEHGGREIKHTGDGIMASFPVASGALACSIAIQQGVAAHVEEHADTPLAVYIGMNAGEPIAEENDLFGTSVDLAARICDQAEPGEILVSDVVRQLAAGKEFLFSDRGASELRGFEDPVKLWELRWQE